MRNSQHETPSGELAARQPEAVKLPAGWGVRIKKPLMTEAEVRDTYGIGQHTKEFELRIPVRKRVGGGRMFMGREVFHAFQSTAYGSDVRTNSPHRGYKHAGPMTTPLRLTLVRHADLMRLQELNLGSREDYAFSAATSLPTVVILPGDNCRVGKNSHPVFRQSLAEDPLVPAHLLDITTTDFGDTVLTQLSDRGVEIHCVDPEYIEPSNPAA